MDEKIDDLFVDVILTHILLMLTPFRRSYVMIGNNWCEDAGIYEFTMGATGDKVKGRYSFVYVWEDGQWKISHHHSSVMPEAFLRPSHTDFDSVNDFFVEFLKKTPKGKIDKSYLSLRHRFLLSLSMTFVPF